LFRILMKARMPLPQPQEPVYDHLGRIVRVDFVYRSLRIVIEADGFAFHSDPLARARDRQRRNRLEIEGWVVLTFTWEDVMFDPHSVVRDVAAAISKRS
jgi:very-short-patch-repair endonuclease